MTTMKEKLYQKFLEVLDTEDKEKTTEYVLQLLSNHEITLEELYLEMLAPSLTQFVCPVKDKEICIWKEHTRTSIIRTILECSYPFVIERRKAITKRNKKVMVLCPAEEYHEIGAIIVHSFFLLAGYDSQYIGANTPKNDILSAVRAIRPDYIAFSVTDYYNVVVTKQVTEMIKTDFPEVKIIVGGQAFLQKGALDQVSYDYYLENVLNLESMLAGEVK